MIGFCFKFPVYGRSGLKFEGERLFSTSSDGLTAKGTGPESSEAITNWSSNPPVRTRGCSRVLKNARRTSFVAGEGRGWQMP